MNNRTFIVVFLIIACGFATNWIMEVADQDAVTLPLARNEPDLYMVNPRITQFTAGGERQHQINAERMTHFPLTDVTTLRVPNVLLYAQTPASPWDIVALNGRLLPQSTLREEVVELWDHVLAVRQKPGGGFINISTESLRVFPGKDYVETNQLVSIDNLNGRTTAGGGMRADLATGRYEFFSGNQQRVLTVLAPHYHQNGSSR